MKGTTSSWEMDDVEDALNVCAIIMIGVALNEERDPRQREKAEKAVYHLEMAKRRVQDAQLLDAARAVLVGGDADE